jgi:uncharacterized protein DUF4325
VKIIAKDIVGENAISMQSGKLLYDKIATPLLSNETVELDFSGVKIFGSPFFNVSIGLLLKDIKLEDLQDRLKITELNADGKQLLNFVIKNALKFYSMDSDKVKSLKEIIKDQDDS